MIKSLRSTVIAFSLVGLGVYLLFVFVEDWEQVWAAFSHLGLGAWLWLLGLSSANYGIRFVRWQRNLLHLGHSVPWVKSLIFYLAGFFFTVTPGKTGEAMRAIYLRREGVSYAHTIAAVFVERLLDVVAVAILSIPALIVFPRVVQPFVLVIAIVIAVLPLIQSKALAKVLARCQASLQLVWLRRAVGQILELRASAAGLLWAGPLYGGLSLGLIGWAMEAIGLCIILDFMGFNLSTPLVFGIYGTSVLVGAISFLPGGLGGTEIAMGLLLHWAGVDLESAIAATLICRVATLWYAVGLGAVAFLGLELYLAGERRGQVRGLAAKDETK